MFRGAEFSLPSAIMFWNLTRDGLFTTSTKPHILFLTVVTEAVYEL
jgi:hypothetical protein